MEKMTIKEFISNFIGTIFLFGIIYAMLLIGSAFEEHQRCLNGAEEFCIAEDFE